MGGECGKLLFFMTGELGEKEKHKYLKHLKECNECSKELEEINDAWNALHMDFEDKAIPESLKEEVLGFVFKTAEKQSVNRYAGNWFNLLKKQFTPLSGGLLLFASALILILVFNYKILQSELETSYPSPYEISKAFQLQAVDSFNEQLTGFALIVNQGEFKELMIQVDHMPHLKGSEVYQVWLLKNGKRENAGIFRTDESGRGMLSFQLNRNMKFDQIGITIEPDENSTYPRGKKVAGTV